MKIAMNFENQMIYKNIKGEQDLRVRAKSRAGEQIPEQESRFQSRRADSRAGEQIPRRESKFQGVRANSRA